MPDGGGSLVVTRDGRQRAVTRRRLLRTGAAATATALAGCSLFEGEEPERPTPQPSPRPSPYRDQPPYADEYGTVVDVADVGGDPSGGTPVNDVLAEHAGDDTLLYFPEGTYVIDGVFSLDEFTHLGLVGDGAALRPAEGYHGYMLSFGTFEGEVPTDFRFENLTFDLRGQGVGARPLQVQVADGLRISDVSVTGRQDAGSGMMRFEVGSPDGAGVVERLHLPDGARKSTDTAACLVTGANRGELRFVDCIVQRFPNNGLYASSSRGQITVDGGYYANNGIANVRVSGGSVVRGVQVRCDDAGPGFPNMRGIRLDDGGVVRVEDCTVELLDVTGADAAITCEPTVDGAVVRNTEVLIDTDDIAALLVKPPDGERTEEFTFERCTIDGSASGGAAVQVVDQDGIVFDRFDVEQTGDGRDGFNFIRSDETVVQDSRIAVTGTPIVRTGGSTVRTSNVVLATPGSNDSA
jgi:hypothetical protein